MDILKLKSGLWAGKILSMRTNFHMLLNFKMVTQMSGSTVESEYSDLISVSQRSSTVGRPRNSPVWDYFSYFPDKGKKGESMCEVMMLKLKPGGIDGL